jgi:cystathionine gamma-lyase
MKQRPLPVLVTAARPAAAPATAPKMKAAPKPKAAKAKAAAKPARKAAAKPAAKTAPAPAATATPATHKPNPGAFATRAIHAGYDPHEHFGAVNPPVFLTSTYAQREPGKHAGFEYSRSGSPTRAPLERLLADIEGADRGFAFSSGLAAIDTIIKATCNPGDHVVSADDVYGGTFRLFDKTFAPWGMKFDFTDTSDPANVKKLLRENTKLVWLESPSNPLLKISDIAAVAKLVHSVGALLVVDNTFATPCLQRPIELGADIVMHSATKYLGGHSDVVLGCAMVRGGISVKRPKLGTVPLGDAIAFHQNASGGVPGPLDCYLVHRGIKTLAIRMDAHCGNAEKIAAFLSKHRRVTRVMYPGLTSHGNHAVAKRQMSRFGGMISFEIDGSVADGVKVVSGRRFWTLGESLGGVESLIEHPCSMTHASIPRELRMKTGLNDGLIRCSAGIEDAGDLIEDLAEGLASY